MTPRPPLPLKSHLGTCSWLSDDLPREPRRRRYGMLFGGEMFRKVAFTAFMAVRRGGIERLLFLFGSG